MTDDDAPRMHAVLPQRSLKEFARIVAFLSKIGDELHLEAGADKLRLSAINPSRTVFANAWLARPFFESYDGARPGAPVLRCQMPNKAVQLVFKRRAALDKTVERCELALAGAANRVVFQLQCKHGVTKTHKLAYEECGDWKAIYSAEQCPNRIVMHPTTLTRMLANFQTGLEDLAWLSAPERLIVHSYMDPSEPADKRGMDTKLVFHAEEFSSFAVRVPSQIAFSLKEFKAVLAFAEGADEEITCNYGESGSPMILQISLPDPASLAVGVGGDGDALVDTQIVLGTLRNLNDSDSQSTQQSTGGAGGVAPAPGASHLPAPQLQQGAGSQGRFTAHGRLDTVPPTDRTLGAVQRNLQFPFESSPTDGAVPRAGQAVLAIPALAGASSSVPVSPVVPRVAARALPPASRLGNEYDDFEFDRDDSPPPDKRVRRSVLDE